jgi:hypothetical protein
VTLLTKQKFSKCFIHFLYSVYIIYATKVDGNNPNAKVEPHTGGKKQAAEQATPKKPCLIGACYLTVSALRNNLLAIESLALA